MSGSSGQNKGEFTLNERMYLSLTKFRDLLRYVVAMIYSIMVVVYIIGIIYDLPLTPFYVVFGYISAIVLVSMTMFVLRRDELRKVLKDYVRQNYYLTFQTQKPEGKDPLEKFMSLAVNVFPPIKQKLTKFSGSGIWWQSVHDKLDGEYRFDLSLKTSEGKFLVKYFTNSVKLSDIEKMIEVVKKFYRKKDLLRIVCLAKKYDDIFFTDELNEKMSKMLPEKIEFKTLMSRGIAKKWINLDLILERENGFTMIWID